MIVKIKTKEGATEPLYKTSGASGCDLYALDNIMFKAGEIKLVETGIFLEIPENFEAQIRTRSSMGLEGVIVLNSPGTIDSDYRGEIKVILKNTNKFSYLVLKTRAIAQMVFQKVEKASFEHVKILEKTERNDGGFGSTNQ